MTTFSRANKSSALQDNKIYNKSRELQFQQLRKCSTSKALHIHEARPSVHQSHCALITQIIFNFQYNVHSFQSRFGFVVEQVSRFNNRVGWWCWVSARFLFSQGQIVAYYHKLMFRALDWFCANRILFIFAPWLLHKWWATSWRAAGALGEGHQSPITTGW